MAFDIYKRWVAHEKLFRTVPSIGTIYYVDGIGGDDDNHGLLALKPLKTIAAALAKCTADKDDVIAVLDCWAQDTFPIEVDVQKVHILGVDMGTGWPRMSAGTDVAIFDLIKDFVEIAGFSLGGAQTTAHGLIEVQESAIGRCNIHHNFLGEHMAGYHGVVLAEGPEAYVHHNIFGAGLQGKGITGQSTRGRYNYNMFHEVPDINIEVTTGAFAEIIGNRFAMKADTLGLAITLQAACIGQGMVDDNRAAHAAASTANPFRDLGTPEAHWMLNYLEEAAQTPALA